MEVVGIKRNKSQSILGYVLIFLAGSFWGTGGYYITQMGKLGASSFMTGFTGHLFALLPLMLIILVTRGVKGLKISKRGLIFAVIMGIVTKGFFKLAYDSSVVIAGVSTAAVLLYTSPVFVAILSRIFFKEKLKAHNYLALVLNLTGVFLMVTLGDVKRLNVELLGVVLALTAALLHASNTILGKFATSGDHPLTTTFYMLVASTITQGIAAKPWTAHNLDLFANSTFLFWAIINALVTGALANTFYLTGLSTDIDASKAPVLSSSEVIVAALIGVLAFSEPMNWIGILGMIMMLVSIVLMNANRQTLKEE